MTTKITEKNISQLANTGVNWQSVFVGDGSTGLKKHELAFHKESIITSSR